jgi:hypothetical protein
MSRLADALRFQVLPRKKYSEANNRAKLSATANEKFAGNDGDASIMIH